jgi:aminopeptidase N
VKYFFCLFAYFSSYFISSHAQKYTEQDSLRGSITKERKWWDLQHYNLNVVINPEKKHISGHNTIRYQVLSKNQRLQIDLQHPMKITRAMHHGKYVFVEPNGNAHYIHLPIQPIHTTDSVTVFFEGIPPTSKNPPWDAGFTWKKDRKKNYFIATSCQGKGASVWWPNKDHMYDEPDHGMQQKYTVPENLIAVGNGRLKKTTHDTVSKTKIFHWQVTQPINNYGVNVNIGNYVQFSEKFKGEKKHLDCNYFVLPEFLEKAKKQFQQVPKTLEALEFWFGPYPFYEDSYKLVQVPYLGMEHQSSVTYGNQFQNGYLGHDLSRTGWGMKFDYIIVHETAHEWFANSITNKDIADMWIHESFATYAESLYLEYHFGKQAAQTYIQGLRHSIQNDQPIIGQYNTNSEGSADMYSKGANMLHTIRQLAKDDQKWRTILRALHRKFYHQTVSSAQIETFLNEQIQFNLQGVFDQYLRTPKIPVFETRFTQNHLEYRWHNVEQSFSMPLKIYLDGKEKWIYPTPQWKKMKTISIPDIEIDPNFYVVFKTS